MFDIEKYLEDACLHSGLVDPEEKLISKLSWLYTYGLAQRVDEDGDTYQSHKRAIKRTLRRAIGLRKNGHIHKDLRTLMMHVKHEHLYFCCMHDCMPSWGHPRLWANQVPVEFILRCLTHLENSGQFDRASDVAHCSWGVR